MMAALDHAKFVELDAAPCKAGDQAFCNASSAASRDLRGWASRQHLETDFRVWLDGFSSTVQGILDSFEFCNQVSHFSRVEVLHMPMEKFASPEANLSRNPVLDNGMRNRQFFW